MKVWNKVCCTVVSLALLAGNLAAPAFAYGAEPGPEPETAEGAATVLEQQSGPLTPEGNLTLVDDYHTTYSDGSGQQFITLVSKSGAYFYLVIDRASDGDQTVHFMNLVDEADLLALMEEDQADAYTAEKEALAQAELERLQAEEEARKAAEEAARKEAEDADTGGTLTKLAAGFLGIVAVIALAAGCGAYFYFQKKKQKQAELEAVDPDADYAEFQADFEVPAEDEDAAAQQAYQTSGEEEL